jgi:hypothetical protein
MARGLAHAPLFTSLFALVLTGTSLRAADRLSPGQWEFTLTTDGGSHTAAHCVTPVEAGEVNGETSDGSLTTTAEGGKAVVTHVQARRVGACKPAS